MAAATVDQQVDLSTIPVSLEGSHEEAAETGQVNSQPVTVFHDPDNFNVKHPLQNAWTLWFTKPAVDKSDSWNELLKEVITFNSVEEFWGIYNNIAPVSELAIKSDYHLFKAGVRPEWEDAQNKYGGKWAFQFPRACGQAINEHWMRVMMAAIGERLEEEGDGEVMGVVVNVRKGYYRICVWTRTVGRSIPGLGDDDVAGGKGRSQAKGEAILKAIGARFKDILKLTKNDVLEFVGHIDSAAIGSTRARSRLTV